VAQAYKYRANGVISSRRAAPPQVYRQTGPAPMQCFMKCLAQLNQLAPRAGLLEAKPGPTTVPCGSTLHVHHHFLAGFLDQLAMASAEA